MTTPAAPSPKPSSAPQPPRTDGTGLIGRDHWLEPYAPALRQRYADWLTASKIYLGEPDYAGPIDCGHHYFGFNRGTHDRSPSGQPGFWYREWAPAARALFLTGDFNGWNRSSHPLTRVEPHATGAWEIFLPDRDSGPHTGLHAGPSAIPHSSKLKVHIVNARGQHHDRIPAWIRFAGQDRSTRLYDGLFWNPVEPHRWTADIPTAAAVRAAEAGGLRIYECHVGMATEQLRVGTYAEFARDVLPRIADLGYNAVQFMAIAEHPYYGSFGYHVSNFFAPSSRCGTPEELKALVDRAHGLGMLVLMDIVHSHAVKNFNEGLGDFDGSGAAYFHAGPRGKHPAWDSLLFNYGSREVLRFLLSNVRYWLEEFRFDGYRFDGVTSLMYRDHGLNRSFNGYPDYFTDNTDREAVTFLQLANTVAHSVRPGVITIAEDVSGMPGLARPVEEGGLGFDYRLSMGLPDFWIKIIKERRDEHWPMGDLWHCLINRRSPQGEKHIAYAESHDQALVGDKTIAFRLMDAEMYWNMARAKSSIVIERGIALHKLIRLASFAFGGEGWLNFMGNEFGHPEWIDFPREGNGYSHQHARRQWSLADNRDLRYGDLLRFDRELQRLDADYGLLTAGPTEQLWCHEEDKLLIGRRGELIIAFNWHPTRSYAGLRVPVVEGCDHRLVLDSDDARFGGQNRNREGQTVPCQEVAHGGRPQSIQVYLPARTAQVWRPTPPSAA